MLDNQAVEGAEKYLAVTDRQKLDPVSQRVFQIKHTIGRMGYKCLSEAARQIVEPSAVSRLIDHTIHTLAEQEIGCRHMLEDERLTITLKKSLAYRAQTEPAFQSLLKPGFRQGV